MKSKELGTEQTPKANGAVSAYLIAYNGFQFFGWTILTYKLLFSYFDTGSHVSMYKDVQPILNLFQTLALLEVVNAATGMVRSNPVLTGFQVASRIFVTWQVYFCEDVHESVGPPLFLLAWGITEIIRYLFYTISLMGSVPYFIVWCRYTFFYVLYPLGVTGELLSVYGTLDFVKKTQFFSASLPNPYNCAFNYYYILHVIMLSYIPIFPQLYFHMIYQRKKIVGGSGKSKSD